MAETRALHREAVVRPGESGDISKIVAIEQAAAAKPWTLSQFLSGSLRDHEASLVLESAAGQLLGFIIYQRVLGEATLMNIAVLPEQQGKGYGADLLEHLLGELAGQGVQRCLLEVRSGNAAAIALYRKYGFVDDGLRKDYYPTATGREDALLMSCQLGDTL